MANSTAPGQPIDPSRLPSTDFKRVGVQALQLPGVADPASEGDVSPYDVTENGETKALSTRFAELRRKLLAQPAQYLSYDAFGDSITAGFAASTDANRYVDRLGAYLRLTPINHGISGSEVADQQPYIYQTAVSDTGSQLFTFMIGTNETAFFGPDPVRQATFLAMHQASLAWLAIPARSKTVGQSSAVNGPIASITSNGNGVATVTTTGAHYLTTGQVVTITGAAQSAYNVSAVATVTGANTFTVPISGTPASPATGSMTYVGPGILYGGAWTPDDSVLAPKISMKSNTQGATAKFKCYGTVCYLAYGLRPGDGGTFTLAVDGVVQGTYSTQGVGTNGFTNTNLGQNHASALARLDSLANGVHTVTLTVTSPSSLNNNVWVDWVSGPGSVGGSQYLAGPTVIAGGAPQQGNGINTAGVFAQLARDSADQLAADGLNTLYADVPGFMNPGTDIIADATHPNDLGMQHIADAYIGALNTAATARAKSGAGAARFQFKPWTSFTPFLTVQTQGSAAPVFSGVNCAFQITGKRVDVRYDFTLASANGASGYIFVTLPNQVVTKGGFTMPITVANTVKFGAVDTGNNYFPIRNMDGTPPTLSDGQRYVGTASYEIN